MRSSGTGSGGFAIPAKTTKLQKRFLSAIVMIGGTIAVTWLGGWWFSALLAVVGCLMLWEWNRMVGLAEESRQQYTVICLATLALTVGLATYHIAAAGGALVLAAIALAIFKPRLLGAGIFYVVLPMIVLIWLRADQPWGLLAVILLFVVVWATDTSAMLVGKSVGGPRLYPSVSPQKTWAGAIGGLLAGGLVGALLVIFTVEGGQWWYGLAIGSMLSIFAQIGDLVESAVKRACKVKDTSALIPGHGGVLDRMDGIVGAAVGTGVYVVMVAPDAPARALVTGG